MYNVSPVRVEPLHCVLMKLTWPRTKTVTVMSTASPKTVTKASTLSETESTTITVTKVSTISSTSTTVVSSGTLVVIDSTSTSVASFATTTTTTSVVSPEFYKPDRVMANVRLRYMRSRPLLRLAILQYPQSRQCRLCRSCRALRHRVVARAPPVLPTYQRTPAIASRLLHTRRLVNVSA